MNLKSIICAVAAAIAVTAMASKAGQKGRDTEMDAFINELMGKMTLEEKLGQFNLSAAGDIVTGEI